MSWPIRLTLAVIALALAVLIRWRLHPLLGDRVPFITIFPAIAFVAWIAGWRIAILCAVIGYVAAEYFFAQPHGEFRLLDNPISLMIAAWYAVAAGIIILMGGLMHGAISRAGTKEEELRLVTDAMPGLISYIDRNLRYRFVNKQYSDWFGRSKEETEGRSVFEVLGEAAMRRLQPYMERALRGDALRFEDQISYPEGPKWIDAQYIPHRNEQGQVVGFFVLVIDITARRQAEDAIRESEERFRTIANSAPALIWINDLEGCEFVNRGYLEFLGVEVKDVRGYDWASFIHPDDRSRYITTYQSAMDRNATFNAEFRFRRHDGEFRWMKSVGQPRFGPDGQLAGYVGTTFDIDDQKRIEVELRESEARKAAIFESAIDALITMDHRGMVVDFNPAAERIFGHARTDVVGKPVADVIIPERLRQPHWDGLRNYLRTGEQRVLGKLIELPAQRADGSEFPCELSISAIRSEHAAPFFTAFARDITERKQIQEQRDELMQSQRAALAESQRVSRMKDEFLATLSHELRTPMSAILGWAHVLGKSAPSSEEIAKAVEVIERNARLQSQLINDMLDMSRILAGKMRLDVQSLNIGEVTLAAVDSIRPAAEAKGVSLQSVCDPSALSLRGDPNRLQQVIFNLLSNAVKFTNRGGKIQVTCRRVNSHVEVSVSDTGIGIDPEFLPQLFQRFHQQDASTTRRFGGLGLGLSIVKQLVELHGGKVQVHSDGKNKGATFTVHLPIAIAVVPELPEQASVGHHPSNVYRNPDQGAASAIDLRGLRIMVVDDEPDARELLQHILAERGADVQTMASAHDALQALNGVSTPNLVLCDIGMPGMDGLEFIRKLRQKPRSDGGRIPAIALTAFARSEDRTRSLMAGFQAHLSKPVEFPELLAAIVTVAGASSKKLM